jgi:hypothetical protein
MGAEVLTIPVALLLLRWTWRVTQSHPSTHRWDL